MTYPISTGIEVSLNGSTWYKLTDHNRESIDSSPELIESANRMANGKMRKYVVAKKNKISTRWSYTPSKTSECVDGNVAHGPAWIESFYNSNAGLPIYIKVNISEIDPDAAIAGIPSDSNFRTALLGSKTYQVFITSFSKTTVHRTKVSDYVDVAIEFTEI